MSLNPSSALLSLFSFQDSVDMNGRSFVIVPKVPETWFTFFSLFFSLLLRLSNFYWLFCLPVPWFFHLCPPFCCRARLLSFHFQLLYFSLLKCMFGSVYLLLLCWGFFFSFVLSVFLHLLKHFYDGCFNICVILVFIDCLFSFKLRFAWFLVWQVIFWLKPKQFGSIRASECYLNLLFLLACCDHPSAGRGLGNCPIIDK